MNKINRRQIIHAGCIATAVTLAPSFLDKAEAIFHRGAASTPSGFNGGKFQTNLNFNMIGGDYPFANFLLDSGMWQSRDNTYILPPDQLTSAGYPLPTSDAMVNHLGAYLVFIVPSIPNGGSRYYIPATGKGTLEVTGNIVTTPIVTITGGATTATINFGSTHFFTVGMEVPILGVSGTIATALNGNKFVCSSISSTSITITIGSNTTGLSGTGGTAACGSLNVDVATGGMLLIDIPSNTNQSGPGPSTGNAITIVFSIRAIDATTPFSSLAFVPVADLARWQADPLAFGSKLLSKLQSRKPGVIRFLNKMSTNDSNVAAWADCKPVASFSFSAQQLPVSLYAGTSTSVLNAYAASLGSGSPSDKQHVTMYYDSAAVTCSISASAAVLTWPSPHGIAIGKPFNLFFDNGGGSIPTDLATGQPLTITGGPSGGISYQTSNAVSFYVLTTPTSSTMTFSFTKGGTPITTSSTGSLLSGHVALKQNTFTSSVGSATLACTNHDFEVGDLIAPPSFQNNSVYPTGISPYGKTYYVKTKTANDVTIAATPSGTAIVMDAAQTIIYREEATYSLNATTARPIKDRGGTVMSMGNNSIIYSRISGSNKCFATLTYDAELACWLNCGASTGFGAYGLNNAWPPQVCLKLCKEVGAHPYWTLPPFTTDPPTDYVTGLATLNKSYAAANATWMIPRFEGINEQWNSGFFGCLWSYAKALAHAGWTSASFHEEYGLQTSCLGQAVQAVYGGAIGSSYKLICGFQSVSGIGSAFSNAPRMDAGQYVAHGPSFAGYTQSPAYNWVTTGVCAQYFSPSTYGTTQEAAWAALVASFTATINTSGVLNATTVSAGTLAVGMMVAGGGVPWQSVIVSQLTGTPGGGGTYQLSVSPTSAGLSQQMYAADANNVKAYADGCSGNKFVGSVSGNQLTVTALTDSWTNIHPDEGFALTGPGLANNTIIQNQISGTPGGVGVYQVSVGGQSVPGGTAMLCGSFTPAALRWIYSNFVSFLQSYTNSAGNHPGLEGYEGGYSPDFLSQGNSLVDQLRGFSKLVTSSPLKANGLQDWYTDNVNGFTAAGGLFWSEFQFSGASSVVDIWSVLDDVYMTPPGPLELAVSALN